MPALLESIEPVLGRVLGRGGDDIDPDEFAEAAAEFGLNVRPGGDDDGWHETPPVTLADGTTLHLYKDGEALGRVFEAVAAARSQVMVETYIWSDDATGNAFADLLAEHARNGLKVFAIYDGVGSAFSGSRPFAVMREAGVQVVEFHPPHPLRCFKPWRPFNRDHRKLFVIDGDTAGIGGLNIGDRYAGKWVRPDATPNPARMWRDVGVGIRGPAAATFARAFAATWRYCLQRHSIDQTLHVEGIDVPPPAKGDRVGKVREGRHPKYGPMSGVYPEDVLEVGRDIASLGTSPTLASPLRPFLYRIVRDARQSIDLTMAYFAPDDELIDGLCEAARRGVAVRLMFAGRTDVNAMKAAARSFYRRLLEAGAAVYERQGAMLHQKTIVVDANLSVLGSTNLDYRSIEFNLELSAVIRSDSFAGQLRALFDLDVTKARQMDLETWRRQPTRDRFVQWAVSRMRYLL